MNDLLTGTIDDRFVDVDFEKQPEYTRGVNGGAFMGSLPTFEASFPVLSERDIDAAIDAIAESGFCGADYVTRVFNQRNEGSCVGNMLAQGDECLQAKQFGKDAVVPMSAISIYKQIGRSAQSGATVSDGLDAITKVGVLPLDTPANRARFGDHVMPHTGFSTRFPSDWQETAKLFRVSEAYVIRDLPGYWTALCNGWFVGVGRAGHSILQVAPIRKSGERASLYVNSWDYSWGAAYKDLPGGFGVDTARYVRESATWAIAFRALKAPWE